MKQSWRQNLIHDRVFGMYIQTDRSHINLVKKNWYNLWAQAYREKKHPGVVVHLANSAYQLQTKKELVEFYHAADGWLVKKTRIATIQRDAYASWLGLEEYMVRRHLEVQEPTVLGHMNACQLGTQSTKKKTGVEKMEDILAKKMHPLRNPYQAYYRVGKDEQASTS